MPWRAFTFALLHIIITTITIPILIISCITHKESPDKYDGEWTNIKTNGAALRDTINTYIRTRMDNFCLHPAWWIIKLYWFHSTMVSLYLAHLCSLLGTQWVLPIIGTLMTPLLPLWKALAYIVGVTTGIIGELTEELFYVTLRWKYYKSEPKPPWN